MIVEGRIRIPYRWPAGRAGDRFLAELEAGRVVGVRCVCGRVSVPPRERCIRCRALCTKWVPVGPAGTVVTWAHDLALVRFDGADTAMLGRMSEPATGTRVRWERDRFVATGGTAPVPPFAPTPVNVRRVPARVKVLATATLMGASELNYMEMNFEVVQRLGFAHHRIDTVISASSDFWDGRTISDIAIQDAVGAVGKSGSKVSMDGAFALIYAAARIASGRHRTCLVIAHGKASEGDPLAISNAAYDPVFERPLGIDDEVVLEMQARRLMPVDLRRAPPADGACAVLLAAEGQGATLESFACATGAHGLGERDLADTGLLAAMGVSGVDVAAISVASAAQARLWSEALGVPMPELAPLPGFATGLIRVAEVVERLRPGQVGLAHGMTGATGQAHCVWKITR